MKKVFLFFTFVLLFTLVGCSEEESIGSINREKAYNAALNDIAAMKVILDNESIPYTSTLNSLKVEFEGTTLLEVSATQKSTNQLVLFAYENDGTDEYSYTDLLTFNDDDTVLSVYTRVRNGSSDAYTDLYNSYDEFYNVYFSNTLSSMKSKSFSIIK